MNNDKVRRFAGIISTLLMVGLLGFLGGYQYGTGEMPFWGKEAISYLPPDYTEVDIEQISTALEADKTNERQYQEGYNCVDFAWDTMRSLSWQGIPSYIVALQFEDRTNHAIMAIPTGCCDLVWADPQSDTRVEPEIGKIYNGKRVVGIKIMTIKWLTTDEFSELAKEGEVNG